MAFELSFSERVVCSHWCQKCCRRIHKDEVTHLGSSMHTPRDLRIRALKAGPQLDVCHVLTQLFHDHRHEIHVGNAQATIISEL